MVRDAPSALLTMRPREFGAFAYFVVWYIATRRLRMSAGAA
jgi:hypothetical protein